MPELPEVETTLRGIQPHIQQQFIVQAIVRQHSLRWPIPKNIIKKLAQQKILRVERRAKYLLFIFSHGTAIIHLGMSGSLRILPKAIPPNKHDHFDIILANRTVLRFTDPRRFGALLWTDTTPYSHALLKHLGPEPLARFFSGKYLWQTAQRRKVSIKTLIMDNTVVVGVGNIYANEALFMAGIHPLLPADQLALERAQQLAKAIKAVLRQAIKSGGTTLKDFIGSDGKPGYFFNKLQVYGRVNLPCLRCNNVLKLIRVAQRSTVFCAQCQLH
jgi:formamidopyrimidine-DNA glycosylase